VRIVDEKIETAARIVGCASAAVGDGPPPRTIKYLDDQGDLVSLLDDSDLEVALLLCPTKLNLQVQ